MIHEPDNAFDTMRNLTTELLSSIEDWRGHDAGPENFRHRLVRAHALALLDELEQLAATSTPSRSHAASR